MFEPSRWMRATGASWGAGKVIASIAVMIAIIAAYLYLTGSKES